MNKLSTEHISSKIFQNIQVLKDDPILATQVASSERGILNLIFLLISELIYKWAGTLSSLDYKYFFSPETFHRILSTPGKELPTDELLLIVSLMIKGISILSSLVFLAKATVGILDFLCYSQEPKFSKTVFYKILHYIYLPHKSLRNKALNSNYLLKSILLFKNKDIFKNISKTNLKEWTDLNIYNKTSIHNLINNHCLGLPELRTNHLYWSQLIPRDKLNLDQYRSLLDSCPIVNISIDLSLLLDISLENLELIFKDYTASDIMRLYKSPYYIYQLVSILNIAYKKSLSLPVYIDMSQLYSFTKKLNLGDNFSFKGKYNL